ncbi:MAG TPA: mobilization protein [Saprospiraceae bacterium]|nr:mobilization protein [Saprospiraceae bacterium]
MIGKGKSISHTKASIQYGWNQEKDAKVILKQNLVGNSPGEITKELEFIQKLNTNCNKNTFSFVLSPTIDDKEKLNGKMLHDITKNFIDKLGLSEHQAVAFTHLDKNHTHIHLYVNRINFDGKAFNDSFIGKKSQKKAEKVAEKLGLKTVKDIQLEKENKTKFIRRSIHDKHKQCIKIDKPKSLEEYIQLMNKYEIKIKPSFNKSNQLLGFRYKYKGNEFKASEVHRSLSINKVALEMNRPSNFNKMYQVRKGIKLANQIVSLNPTLLLNITKSLSKTITHKI